MIKIDTFYIDLHKRTTTIRVPAKSKLLSLLPAPMDWSSAILSVLCDHSQEKWGQRTFRVFINSWDAFDDPDSGGGGNISSSKYDLQFVGTIHRAKQGQTESLYVFEELKSTTHFKIPGAGPIVKRTYSNEDDVADDE